MNSLIYIKKKVLKQHRLSKSNSDLNLLKDETNSETSGPIQKGLTFDKWLSQKLRAKKLEILKKKEEAKIEIIERYALDEAFKILFYFLFLLSFLL